jgi:hydrogenase maturation protease
VAEAVLVIGLGNELRRDDGAGIEVARRVRDRARGTGIEVRQLRGEPTGLLDLWRGFEAVVITDTMCSGAPPGTLRRLDASHEPLPANLDRSCSTHAVALGGAIELARTLNRLPARVVVCAIEGRRFDAGDGLSDAVRRRTPELVEMVLDEARALLPAARG